MIGLGLPDVKKYICPMWKNLTGNILEKIQLNHIKFGFWKYLIKFCIWHLSKNLLFDSLLSNSQFNHILLFTNFKVINKFSHI